MAWRGQVKRVAILAAIDLSIGPVLPFEIVSESMPAFQMSGAEFALGVLFIAGTLVWEPRFDRWLRSRFLFSRRSCLCRWLRLRRGGSRSLW